MRAIQLLSFDGHLSATGGCNGITGPFVIENGELRFTGDAMRSLAGCTGPTPRQDDWISDLVDPAARIELTEGGHVLRLSRGSRWASFGLQGPSDGPSPLEERQWRAAGAVTGPMIRPALRLSDGRAELFTGCNSAAASVDVDDHGAIEFGTWDAQTHRPCPGYLGWVDRNVRRQLNGRRSYTFHGATEVDIEGPGEARITFGHEANDGANGRS